MHKRWLTTDKSKTKYTYFIKIDEGTSTRILLNAHFGDKYCRSTMFLMEENRSLLLARSCKNNKNGNCIEANILHKRSYLLYVYVEDPEGKPADVNITVYTASA